jgi:Sulfotransferase domain
VKLKLIGAGLPRTATLTQKIALEMLGFGPCYHMVNILNDLDLVQLWHGAFDGHPEWNRMFAGYQATTDWPGAFFYRELIAAYPDAKVVLSVRDGATWSRSMRDTIWGVLYGDTMMRDLSAARSRVDAGWSRFLELMMAMWEKSGLLGAIEAGFEASALGQAMERYNAEVRQSVPPERLLVWTAADGWGPLCEFLEVPVPVAPLPRVNDAAMFADRIIEGSMAALVQWQEQQQTVSARQ